MHPSATCSRCAWPLFSRPPAMSCSPSRPLPLLPRVRGGRRSSHASSRQCLRVSRCASQAAHLACASPCPQVVATCSVAGKFAMMDSTVWPAQLLIRGDPPGSSSCASASYDPTVPTLEPGVWRQAEETRPHELELSPGQPRCVLDEHNRSLLHGWPVLQRGAMECRTPQACPSSIMSGYVGFIQSMPAHPFIPPFPQ